MSIKKKLVIIIIAICPIILCGCWNNREIDTLAIVAGMAIDKDIITNKYIVTTEIITTKNQGAFSNFNSELFSSESQSIFGAVRNMIEVTGLKLFWSATKVLIISESIADESIIPVIDWANRSPEIRPNIWIMIAKGNSAAEILQAKGKLNGVISFHLDETMMSGKILSKFSDSCLCSFVDGISSVIKSETIATIKNEVNNGTKTPRLIGTSVFKLDKLVGYLDGNETLYMLMIQNKIKEGLIILKNVSGSDTGVTLEINGNTTKLTPLYNNGMVSLLIDIYPIVSIGEVQGTKNFMNEENLKLLQNAAEKKIQTDVQSLITKLQKDYHSDVLGFGEVFEKEKPKIMEILKKNEEDVFQILNTEINVHLKINGSGRTFNSIDLVK